MTSQSKRLAIVEFCAQFKQHQNLIDYAQERPFPVYTKIELDEKFAAGEVINEWDCSASTIQIFHLAGAKDPTGLGYAGFNRKGCDGNTELMLGHLKHYSDPRDAHFGALVILGVGLPLSQQHVCITTVPGRDPIVFSHGQPFSCIEIPLSLEQKSHGGQTVFLDIGPLL